MWRRCTLTQHGGTMPVISPVDAGRVTGQFNFHVSLPVERADGSFAGVVLATVRPSAFSGYYRQLAVNGNSFFALLGSEDRRLRARLPEPTPEQWAVSLPVGAWSGSAESASGVFDERSPFDGVERRIVFRHLPGLPLVMLVGFNISDIEQAVGVRFAHLREVALSGLALLAVALIMLTLVLINRDRLATANARLENAYRQMRDLATTDTLTGLPARAMFFDRLAQALSSAHRQEQQVGLLFLDLDGFKAVNDSHGHDAGDCVLKTASRRWQALVRESDTVARLGGDEFAVIIVGIEPGASLVPVCEKLIDALKPGIPLPSGVSVPVGVSIGVAVYPENGLEIDSLLAAADAAMYQSKARGKNTWTLAQHRPQTNGDALDWLVFSDLHLLGVAELDAQHRELVRLVNRINRAVTGSTQDAAQVSGLFSALGKATRTHFATEEEYMKRHAYPGAVEHVHDHARLLAELEEIAGSATQGNELLMLQTLKDWLLAHIQGSDRQLGEYLVRCGCS